MASKSDGGGDYYWLWGLSIGTCAGMIFGLLLGADMAIGMTMGGAWGIIIGNFVGVIDEARRRRK